ncbi:hypothetical protein ACQEVZ_42380 [Dactylosporangium sp. CA-152071]|uniref:hypothetical protein n=1 Tax=Dactylosporangium sp. CA-152071 TaxID=3239933 RepID=UPI003D900EAB
MPRSVAAVRPSDLQWNLGNRRSSGRRDRHRHRHVGGTMIRVHRHSTGRVHAPLATSSAAAAGVTHIRALMRLGGLARQAAAATGRDRVLLVAEAYAIVWPVVFSRLSAAALRSHRGYGTDATGLRPDSPDRFEGDVQAMLAPLTPFGDGAATAVGEGWTAHRPWAPWLIAALREDRAAWRSHGTSMFLDLLVIEHVRIAALVTAATDFGAFPQVDIDGADTTRAVGAAAAGADRGSRGVSGAAQRPCTPLRLQAVARRHHLEDRLDDWRTDRRRTVSPTGADAGVVVAWPDGVTAPTARPAAARRSRCSMTPGVHAPGSPRCGTSRCRDVRRGRSSVPVGTGTGSGRSCSDPAAASGAWIAGAGSVLRRRRNPGGVGFAAVSPLAVGGRLLHGGGEAMPATAPGVVGTAGGHRDEPFGRGGRCADPTRRAPAGAPVRARVLVRAQRRAPARPQAGSRPTPLPPSP